MKPKGKRFAIAAGALALAVLGLATWRTWPHLRFWWLFEPLGPNAQGYTEYRHRQTGIIFVSLPGGKFWMGAQKDDPKATNYDPEALPHEGPVHEVTLSPFLIAKFEVTQDECKRVMGRNPSDSKGPDLPVERVSWDDCQEFCRKAGLKLPTEAQWEYARRGATRTPYGGTGKLEDMGWFHRDGGDKTHPMGEKQANGFGLCDMHGKAQEWCEDVYIKSFYSMPEAPGPDPVCTAGSALRVLRPGPFYVAHGSDRCASRSWSHSNLAGPGFRVVPSPPP
jgi:formylglycine-generating enzyme required for sulfatase activity